MLQPARTKYRKQQKGRNTGVATRGNKVSFGEYGLMGRYRQHPDINQQNFFFGLLKECLDNGMVTESFLREEMRLNHVRHDAIDVLKNTPDLPPPPRHPLAGVIKQAA